MQPFLSCKAMPEQVQLCSTKLAADSNIPAAPRSSFMLRAGQYFINRQSEARPMLDCLCWASHDDGPAQCSTYSICLQRRAPEWGKHKHLHSGNLLVSNGHSLLSIVGMKKASSNFAALLPSVCNSTCNIGPFSILKLSLST